MADIEDVRDALAGLINSATHPGGASVTGAKIAVYGGMPNGPALDADLRAGACHIAVNEQAGHFRLLRQGFEAARAWNVGTPTMSATVAGNTITYAGTPTAVYPVHAVVDGVAYGYLPTGTDTLASVVSALAALIAYDRAATASGAVLTVPGVHTLAARFAATGTAVMTTRRQMQAFKVELFAPSPALRRTVGTAIDAALSQIVRFALSDGTSANLWSAGATLDDMPQRDAAYLRLFRYQCDFETTVTQTATTIAAATENVVLGGLRQFGDRAPSRNILTTPDGNSVLIDGAGNPIGSP